MENTAGRKRMLMLPEKFDILKIKWDRTSSDVYATVLADFTKPQRNRFFHCVYDHEAVPPECTKENFVAIITHTIYEVAYFLLPAK